MTITELRVKMLREMDNYIRATVDDDELFEFWLLEGVPDEADDHLLRNIATLETCWKAVINAFIFICKQIGIIEE